MTNISMTEVPLICHTQSLAGAIAGIGVTITRGTRGEVSLTYRVSGETGALEIPARSTPHRIDGLWKNTCFELFIGNFEDETYLEYNFSPSRQWAAYQFAGYRSDRVELETNAPNIRVAQTANALTLTATIALPDAWRERSLRAGISAVMATKSGDISYWAAAHPPGKPDFHHKDCFAVQLEARSAA
ncbi:MAG: DOMON-like domain-containing protein [Sphingomonadaceae bacterium]|nr:DOMON-like domain-containing protein [Sphingomonadaceae bacterium]